MLVNYDETGKTTTIVLFRHLRRRRRRTKQPPPHHQIKEKDQITHPQKTTFRHAHATGRITQRNVLGIANVQQPGGSIDKKGNEGQFSSTVGDLGEVVGVQSAPLLIGHLFFYSVVGYCLAQMGRGDAAILQRG